MCLITVRAALTFGCFFETKAFKLRVRVIIGFDWFVSIRHRQCVCIAPARIITTLLDKSPVAQREDWRERGSSSELVSLMRESSAYLDRRRSDLSLVYDALAVYVLRWQAVFD